MNTDLIEVNDSRLFGSAVSFMLSASFLGLLIYLFLFQFTPISGSKISAFFNNAVVIVLAVAIIFLYIQMCVAQTVVFIGKGDVEIRRDWLFYRNTTRRNRVDISSCLVTEKNVGAFTTRKAFDVMLTFSDGNSIVITRTEDAHSSGKIALPIREWIENK